MTNLYFTQNRFKIKKCLVAQATQETLSDINDHIQKKMRGFQANHLTILHFYVREQLEGYSTYQGIQGSFHSNDHHSHTYAWQAHAVRTVENTCSAVYSPRDNHRLPWGRGVCGHSLDRVGLGSEHSHQLKLK